MSPKPTPAGGAAVDALLDPAFLTEATNRPAGRMASISAGVLSSITPPR